MQFFPLRCLHSTLEVREPTVEAWGFTTSSTAENACTVYLCQTVGTVIKSNWPIVHSDWNRKAIVHSDWIRKLCIVTGLGN